MNDLEKNKNILISIGSNLGDRKKNIEEAIRLLNNSGLISEIKSSDLYETEPYGNKNQPSFLNNVISCKTSLSPKETLELFKNIEINIGRIDRGRWQSREIDLDLLLYDSSIINEEDIKIPHPEMHLRKFVLQPACDIVPDIVHPIFNKTIKELLSECIDTCNVELYKSKI